MDHCTTVLKSFDRVGSQQNHSSAAFYPLSLQYATEVAWERLECPQRSLKVPLEHLVQTLKTSLFYLLVACCFQLDVV